MNQILSALTLGAVLLTQSAISAGGGGTQALANAPTASTCAGITGTYTTCFDTVQNPIASPWASSTVDGYTGVQVTSRGAQSSSAGGKGFGILSGVSLPDDQSARMVYAADSGWNVGIIGVCVRMDVYGNGYCFLPGVTASYVLDTGNGTTTPVTGCPGTAAGHTFELSAVGSTLTCKDLTAGTSASGTDSRYGSGTAGFIVDDTGDPTTAITKFGAS
ncbi:hypothetical protein [Edaphobacter modestus]|uniref:Uncharacterized protein n=1 Tax=Edaphobacter modestus TaxID=388466 RepID=A0A4Q7YR78_9BACT|nr:hypothetical protein [Edaphobacter modestus]RZU39315.1 hypothetical protein BDD14_0684 [Edaphobacter modestus]